MEFATTVAGIPLPHPIMNAAGTCKVLEGPEGVKTLARTATAAVMVGSLTMEPRPGNQGEVFHLDFDELFSLNSLGLPNPGATVHLLLHMHSVAEENEKPLFVSVAGFAPEEFGQLAEIAARGGAKFIELNLGCPNVRGADGKQKRIFCFYPELVEATLAAVARRNLNVAIGVKLSPYSDPYLLHEVASVVVQSKIVKAVVTCNTFPNALSLDHWTFKPHLTPNEGLGGLAGTALRQISLGQVYQWRQALPQEIDVIRVGGVSSGRDVLESLSAGAAAAQLATAYLKKGGRIFGSLIEEAADIREMDEEG